MRLQLFVLALVLLSHRGVAGEGFPNLPLVFDPASKKYFIGGSSKFLLRSGDDSGPIDRIEVSVDGGEYQPYGQPIEFKEEGKHTLKFRAVNHVNNWSPVQFVEVFVDLTPATTQAKFEDGKYYTEAGDGGGVYLALNSTVSLASQDNLSGVANLEFSWDGSSFTPYSQPIRVEKAGKQTLHYRSSDRVGNIETARSIQFVVDGSAPASELKLTGPTNPAMVNGKRFVSDAMAFAITATDDASKTKQIWVSIDNGKPQVYIEPIYFLQEGAHNLSYYSVDNVGNKEEAKSIAVYTVSTPPRTTVSAIGTVVNTGGINYARKDLQLKLDASDNVVGLDRIEFKMDGTQEFKTYLEPIRMNGPGLHNIVYRAVDRAGNTEPAKTYAVMITETPPETTLSTAQPLVEREGVVYSSSPNVVTLNVGNTPVGLKHTLVSLNDGNFTPYGGPITLTSDRRIFKITYKSVDKLGNEEIPKTTSVHMIGSSPTIDLFLSNGKSSEEQIRTNYLEGGAVRGVASDPGKKKKD